MKLLVNLPETDAGKHFLHLQPSRQKENVSENLRKCKYQFNKSCVFSAVVTCIQEVDFDGVPMDHESGFPTLMHTSFREEDGGMPQEKEMNNRVGSELQPDT